MPRLRHNWLAPLVAGLLVAATPRPAVFAAPAQVGPGRGPEDNPSAFSAGALPDETGGELNKQLAEATESIRKKAWGPAARRLQSLLDRTEDVFFQVPRRGGDGKKRLVWVSCRKEAGRLLETLPAAGMAEYRRLYGPEANRLLERAKRQSDPRLFAEVVRRFLYTDAGPEAARWMATYSLDRGEFLGASLCFTLLLRRVPPQKLTASTLFRAALAYHGAYRPAEEERVWKHLEARSVKGCVQLGRRTVTLNELRKALARMARPEAGEGP